MTRVAVVGCGYWGPNVVRNFNALPQCELRVVCDMDESRLASMRRSYPNVRTSTDFTDVLEDPEVDAVALCTPVRTHYPLARAALEAGKHVLVEKPLTDSVSTACELVALAESRGLILQVDHTFLYSGAVQKIRSIIDEGGIGEFLYFDSVRINLGLFQSDVNVVWDLAAHDASIMTYLLQRMPLWVSAIGSAHYGPHENIAYLTMKYEGSLIAHIHVNWLSPVKLRSTVIGGSKRMIVYDDLEPSEKLKIYDKGVSLSENGIDRDSALVDYRVGDMSAPYIDKHEPLQRVCQAFLDAIATGEAPFSDGKIGARVVRILEAAQRSIQADGQPIAP